MQNVKNVRFIKITNHWAVKLTSGKIRRFFNIRLFNKNIVTYVMSIKKTYGMNLLNSQAL